MKLPPSRTDRFVAINRALSALADGLPRHLRHATQLSAADHGYLAALHLIDAARHVQGYSLTESLAHASEGSLEPCATHYEQLASDVVEGLCESLDAFEMLSGPRKIAVLRVAAAVLGHASPLDGTPVLEFAGPAAVAEVAGVAEARTTAAALEQRRLRDAAPLTHRSHHAA